ncbi:MAG: hypothetical protein IK073_08020 [Paludibacteraceae bacterium]|nr:hypothetical protein [Paludibacteraceae bacterium]
MKAKYLILIATLATAVFTSCEKQDPYDTQSPDDAPLILVPYETKTGQITYTLANPDTPLKDSVVVTPSAYTTVNWYLDDELVYTGTKIEKCFLAGNYSLTLEAVTTAGKRTSRTGTVTVNPYPEDPSSQAPAAGRHFVPGTAATLTGVNLTKVKTVVVSRDLGGNDVVCAIDVTAADDATLTFDLPEMAEGVYFVRFKDAAGKLYGADTFTAHNSAVALAGYESFVPNEAWTITGVKLENVASVTVDETVITELTATATSITFMAPAAEVGEHTLSMKNADGSSVFFITDAGAVTEVTTIVSEERTLWEGSCVINWGDANVNVDKATMANVPAGSTVYIYYNVPDADYHSLRVVVAPDWSADLLPQVDGMQAQANPYTFVYDNAGKAAAEAADKNGILITGFGLEITKVTYK